MAKKGLPTDSIFRRTDRPAERQAAKSPSKQRDNEQGGIAVAEHTGTLPRQTYYVPEEVHSRLKILAVRRKVNVSDLAVEGLQVVLEKYGG